MAFDRPTFTTIREQIQADFNSRLPGVESRLKYTFTYIYSFVIAGAVHLMYGFLAWGVRQLFPEFADEEYLIIHGERRGIIRKAATAAQGSVTFTGTNGTDIPAGSELQRADGVTFTTDALATIAGGTATVAVTASVAAVAGNTVAGVTVTLTTPIPGITSDATVAVGGLTGGADIELLEDYRVRVMERWQQSTQGGSKTDYILWAKEVTGVTRAWSYPLEDGDGTVAVRFMMDDTYTDGIPLAADVTAVQTYIDTRRPPTGNATVKAPVAVPLDLTLSVTPNTPAVQAAVEAEFADFIRRSAEPGGTIKLSQINEAISTAEGEEDHTLTAPAADVTHTADQIATPGVITWV